MRFPIDEDGKIIYNNFDAFESDTNRGKLFGKKKRMRERGIAMKKIFSVMLMLGFGVSLFCGCANTNEPDPTVETQGLNTLATDADIAHLESLYQGQEVVHGDMHGHSASSEYSDGKRPLSDWKTHMTENQIDFSTIVDHRQVLHMWHEDWDDTVFVGGSEPGMYINGTNYFSKNNIDYAMVFPNAEGLEAVLYTYQSEYLYINGRFKSGLVADHAKLAELNQCIRDNGGMFVYVHPFSADGYYDPVEMIHYGLADEIGFEVTNGLLGSTNAEANSKAYECWVYLLENGKRLWATCGSDSHTLPGVATLTTLYTAQRNSQGYFDQMFVGNMTAGPAGIRIAVGDAVTGSVGSFEGNRVVVAAGDFHPLAMDPTHTYRLDVYDDTGLVTSQQISTTQMNYLAFDADASRKFYRANVYDVTGDKIFAVGNPVWNG